MDKYKSNKHPKCIRTINFDLDTHALQEQYPTKNWRKAYNDIERYLISKGFSHRQGSGYISDNEISIMKVTRTLNDLKRELPYLCGCVNKIDVASIVDTRFDYNYIFEPTTDDTKSIAKEDAKEFKSEQTNQTVDDPQDWYDNTNDEDEELDLTTIQNRGR